MNSSNIKHVTVAMFVILINNQVDPIVIFDGDPSSKVIYDNQRDPDIINNEYIHSIPDEILNKPITQISVDEYGTFYINIGEKIK